MSDPGTPRADFRAGAVRTGRYWLDYVRAHAGDPAALNRARDNVLQAIQSCYEFAEAHRLVVELVLALHDHMERQGAWDLWVDYLTLAIQAGEQLGDSKATARLLDRLGVTQRQLGHWDDAQAHLERAREIQAQVGDEAGLATTLNNLGVLYWFRGDLDRSLASFEQARSSHERLGDEAGLSRAHTNIGNVHWKRGAWNQAAECFHRALEIDRRLDDQRGLASNYNNLGIIYRLKGEWDRALAYYEKALSLEERFGDRYGIARAYSNIGVALEKKGKWGQSLEYHERAHTIRQAIGDEWGIALCHLNIGIVHYLKGEWGQARWHCEQVLDRAEQLEDPSTLALTCNTLGLIHHERGEDTQAQQYLEQALTWCQKSGDPHDMAQVHLSLGNLARDGGQWEQALRHYDQAEELAGPLGSAPHLAHLALQRTHLYARQADWPKALPFGEQALAQWERLGNRQMILECLALLARVQLTLEDRPAFTTLVDRATQLARDLDRTDVAVRLHTRVRPTRSTMPTSMRWSCWDILESPGLTPSSSSCSAYRLTCLPALCLPASVQSVLGPSTPGPQSACNVHVYVSRCTSRTRIARMNGFLLFHLDRSEFIDLILCVQYNCVRTIGLCEGYSMPEKSITVNLPEPAFRKLQRAAELTYRSVDEILASTINATLVAPPDLPPELADELAAMHLLNDEALWAAVEPSLSPAEQRRLEQLNHAAGERPLTEAEAQEQAALLKAYHRSVLRRAQALAILVQRGHPISPDNLSPDAFDGDTPNS